MPIRTRLSPDSAEDNVRAGSLYHTVERLHRLALIEPVETGREGRRPERTVYAITDAGRDEFTSNLRDLLRFPAARHAGLLEFAALAAHERFFQFVS